MSANVPELVLSGGTVHTPSGPGLEHKEDLETGSRAAVIGGITAVFEMPDTNPNTDTYDRVNDKLTCARHRMFCDHAF